jgi:hypothetical protein
MLFYRKTNNNEQDKTRLIVDYSNEVMKHCDFFILICEAVDYVYFSFVIGNSIGLIGLIWGVEYS